MQKMFYIVAMALMVSSGFANEPSQEQRKAGSRAMDNTEWVKIQEERADQAKKMPEKKSAALQKMHGPQAASGIHFTSHAGAFHNPLVISFLGDSMELEDGSVWSISSKDSYKTLNWLTSDLLVITPNHDWFTSYRFRITNQSTGVSVRCNLSLLPVYNGLYTHWITAINYYTQEIALEDGSIWQISGFDSSTFTNGPVNDTIIIGVNDGSQLQRKHPYQRRNPKLRPRPLRILKKKAAPAYAGAAFFFSSLQ